MTLLLHYRLASSGDLSLLFLTLLTVVNWQHLELGKRSRLLLSAVRTPVLFPTDVLGPVQRKFCSNSYLSVSPPIRFKPFCAFPYAELGAWCYVEVLHVNQPALVYES